MLGILSKPIGQISADDIHELLERKSPEDYEIEFKETLPNKSGGTDPWIAGKDEIGTYARDQILAEVVAFANAQGGTLLLGVSETDEKPPRAQSLSPLPRVRALAQRLEDQARSCIDPPLSRLQIWPVETSEKGDGVIVLRVPASRAAPHRLNTTSESFIRRGASKMRMTMREIQDMTLNLARGLAAIDGRFNQRRIAFKTWGAELDSLVALRITALPLVELPDPGRLFGRQGLWPPLNQFNVRVGQRTKQLVLPSSFNGERPCLRGIVRSDSSEQHPSRWELHQNGMTDLWASFAQWRLGGADNAASTPMRLYHGWVLAGLVSVLLTIEQFRNSLGIPDAEYGLEIEICRLPKKNDVQVTYAGLSSEFGLDDYEMPQRIDLIRLSIASKTEFLGLINTVDTDIYDALGVRRGSGSALEIEF
jgi:hypothetical protein